MIAGIVLFNPDISRLQQNINTILPQVEKLILVDNGSKNIDKVQELLNIFYKSDKVYVLLLGDNFGIAKAQNEICRWALNYGYEWAITLDQDSVCPNNLVEEYKKIIMDPSVGMVCPKITDRNFGEIFDGLVHEDIEEVSQCIASASAIRISVWEEVGGFYEPLFIDSVDFDICWSIREHGYKIIRNNKVVLLHEVGHSRVVHFAGKDRLILNHTPLRYYYKMRNSFIVGRRHHRLYRSLRASCRLVYQINRYENNRLAKNKMLFIGFLHGIIGITGKYGK